MRYRRTLRARIALVSGTLVLALGGLFLLTIHVQGERLERDLVRTSLERTLDGVRAAGGPEGRGALPSDIRLYGPGLGEPPPALRELGPGMHELELGGRTLEVLVESLRGSRYVMTYDETVSEAREHRAFALAALVVALAVVTAGVLGYWGARPALAPLRHFAARLRGLPADEAAPALEPDYAGTEVGEIAEAFDRYRARLAGFVERERAFTSAASHELRTSLAVVQNAAELVRLRDLPAERRREAARRIEEASAHMSELLTALLYLAREQEAAGGPEPPPCAVDDVVAEVLAHHRAAAEAKGLRLELERGASFTARAERPLVAVVVGNLLDNAIACTDTGVVAVTVGDGRVAITDTGPGIPRAERERLVTGRSGESAEGRQGRNGLGLTIVARICERRGWLLSLDPGADGGTTATVRFGA